MLLRSVNLQTQVAGLVDVTVEMSSAGSSVIWSAGPLAAVEGDASTFHPCAIEWFPEGRQHIVQLMQTQTDCQRTPPIIWADTIENYVKNIKELVEILGWYKDNGKTGVLVFCDCHWRKFWYISLKLSIPLSQLTLLRQYPCPNSEIFQLVNVFHHSLLYQHPNPNLYHPITFTCNFFLTHILPNSVTKFF